ncbi:MAG: GxxExxY protein [Chloroherpetonaceae bacterium]
MIAIMDRLLHQEITDAVIKAYYDVYNELGYGFLEKVYQNAMYLELKRTGFKVDAQKQIKVYYKSIEVGEYYSDLVVNDLVILELKANEVLAPENELQLLNYLRATDKEVGLLLNFGKKAEFRRLIFTNDRKKHLKNR